MAHGSQATVLVSVVSTSSAATVPPVPPRRPRRVLAVLRLAAFAACIALFVQTLASANLGAAWARIRAIGPLAVVAFIPFPFAMAADAAAWQRLLRTLERRVPWRKLMEVRLVTEAITNSAPVGAVWSEAISPLLVAERTTASVPEVFAASTAKRWLVIRMHGLYVAFSLALGWTAVAGASRALLGGEHALPFLVLLGALVLVVVSLGIEAIAARGQIAGRISGRLGKARLSRVQAWIEKRHAQFQEADAWITRISTDARASGAAMARLSLLWAFEALETYTILRLLGADLGIVEVMSFDAALSVVRSAAIFAPAGIGVQDVGYLMVLRAYGVHDADAIGPAFVVIKRVKEACWIAIGFAVLALGRRAPR